MRPSFIGLASSGFLILIALIAFVMYYNSLTKSDVVIIVLLLSVAISIHSIQHNFEEILFGFNPLKGQWIPSDTPQVVLSTK